MFSKLTTIPTYQIDAFTNLPFKGNPAAVCLISKDYSDEILRDIAAEMNLSETAFLYVPSLDDLEIMNKFRLRWFTPKVEVNLCGHATLATAHLLFHVLEINSDSVNFETLSGTLNAKKAEQGVILNFPENEPEPIDLPIEFFEALGLKNCLSSSYSKDVYDVLVEVESTDIVKELKPNFPKLKSIELPYDIRGVMITARSEGDCDFVSRFFAPKVGINEDPVTGSAHTILGPYWSKKLNKTELFAKQISERGGELTVKLVGNKRVELIGNAKLVMKGEIYV